MGETLVYGGVEGGGTHSTVMIFDKVNIWLTSPTKGEYDAEILKTIFHMLIELKQAICFCKSVIDLEWGLSASNF